MRRTHLVDGGEIDRRLSLRPGTAERLAKKNELPHVRLPNGVIRFRWPDVVRCLRVHQLKEEASTRGFPLKTGKELEQEHQAAEGQGGAA